MMFSRATEEEAGKLMFQVLLPAFPILWLCMCKVLSVLSGWSTLAEWYRAGDSPAGMTKWQWQSATLGSWANYNNCLTFSANQNGLGLSVMFLFRFGSPAFFIPWTDLSLQKRKRSIKFWLPAYSLSALRVPKSPIGISNRLAKKIKEAAGDALREEGEVSTPHDPTARRGAS
jgi:hypothetical protein